MDETKPVLGFLPKTVRYPVKITALLVAVGQSVAKHDPVLRFTFQQTVLEDDEDGEPRATVKEFMEQFDSPWEGIIDKWLIDKDAEIASSEVPIVSILEPCDHAIEYAGLCAQCGKDMTEVDYTVSSQKARPMINMSHDNLSVTVSLSEASRLERQTMKRLLKCKKLSLIVDLDQTIVHATVDPTIGDWQADKNCPNHSVVKDLDSFQLQEGSGHVRYYIKIRPGLQNFLGSIAQYYEMHIYTMGTRAYAENIVRIVDPEGKYFGSRILSRDESGSITEKSLQRLFPCDTRMVVIIDDRADVWQWSPNLLRVPAYDFFVGVGDINSSFLPKTDSIYSQSSAIEVNEASIDSGDMPLHSISGSGGSTVDKLLAMTGDSDPDVLAAQTDQKDAAVKAQLIDRPLAKKQERLDAERLNSDTISSAEVRSQNSGVLHDDDDELIRMESALLKIYNVFYRDVEKFREIEKLERLDELDSIPDIKAVIPAMKQQVLSHVVIVFSGIIPMESDVLLADISLWAQSFGAIVMRDLNLQVTHLVAAKLNTEKMKIARKMGSVKIVQLSWLLNSISAWRCLPVDKYEFPSDNIGPLNDILNSSDILSDQGASSDNKKETEQNIDAAQISSQTVIEESSAPSTPGQLDQTKLDAVDWTDADKELEEFLAESDTSADDDETRTDTPASRSRKRLLITTESPSQSNLPLSPLAKRRCAAQQRSSNLSQSFVPDNDTDSIALVSAEESSSGNESDSESGNEDLDDFAAELEAELG